DRQAGHPCAGQQAGDGHPDPVQQRDAGENGDQRAENVLEEPAHGVVGGKIQTVLGAAQQQPAHGGGTPGAQADQESEGQVEQQAQDRKNRSASGQEGQPQQRQIQQQDAQDMGGGLHIAVKKDVEPFRQVVVQALQHPAQYTGVEQRQDHRAGQKQRGRQQLE